MMKYLKKGKCIYKNIFQDKDSIKDWILEGQAKIQCNNNGLILENELDSKIYGDNAHFVFWCNQFLKDKIIIEWDFKPLNDEGLCMLFFYAIGKNNENIFSEGIPKRHGIYREYHSGEINTLHLSYYRRKYQSERKFNTCNLRKSCGFNLVKMAADPIPSVENVIDSYHMKLVKYEELVQFFIDDLLVLEWIDDGLKYGEVLREGNIGFRQMSPMKALYSNLYIYEALTDEG